MATTGILGLVYPDESSVASINVAVGNLAGSVDAKVGPYVLDTGWIQATSTESSMNVTGVMYARVGKTVFVRIRDMIRSSGSGTITAFTLPASFAPGLEVNPVLSRSGGAAPGHDVWLAANGEFRGNFVAGQSYRGIFSYYKA